MLQIEKNLHLFRLKGTIEVLELNNFALNPNENRLAVFFERKYIAIQLKRDSFFIEEYEFA